MKINRPNWISILHTRSDYPSSLDAWFDRRVKPVNRLLSRATKVYSKRFTEGYAWDLVPENKGYTGLLIDLKFNKNNPAQHLLKELYNDPDLIGDEEFWESVQKVLNIYS